MKNNIISLSGGKDSTAMLLMMLESNEPIHSVVFFDTGWEFPEMIEHINKLEIYTGIKFVKLKPPETLDYLLTQRPFAPRNKKLKKRNGYGWPSMRRRWCTRSKIDTIEKYYKTQSNFTSCIGFTTDESKRIPVNLKKKWVTRYPLIEYDISETEALQYCYGKGFDWGGLYEIFKRTSCYCCPLQRIGELRKLRKHFPDLWQRMLEMDKAIPINKGFRGWKTVHDLEKRFTHEDKIEKRIIDFYKEKN